MNEQVRRWFAPSEAESASSIRRPVDAQQPFAPAAQRLPMPAPALAERRLQAAANRRIPFPNSAGDQR
jgi:hypothetical protein